MMIRLFLFLASLPGHALALAWDPRWNKFRDPVAGNATGFGSNFLVVLAEGWYTFMFDFIAGISIIAIIWGASTMQGVATDEANKENGKKIIIGALIGLVFALLAHTLIDFVRDFIDANNIPVCGPGGGPGCP